MYIPKAFAITDRATQHAFIEANGFGQLISSCDGRPYSTHLPFMLSADKKYLLGHLAANNPQLRDLEGQLLLVTLQGAHDYISPSWYSKPGVPTWNYQALHIYGCCRLITQPQALAQLVNQLSEKYEAGFAEPWQPDYQASLLGAIVGFEIEINDIECKFKLSQNRSSQERAAIVRQLEKAGASALAPAMDDSNI